MKIYFQLSFFLFFLQEHFVQVMSDVDEENIKNYGQIPSQLELYRSLFKQKRAEQMMAVESIIKMEKYEKRYQIINMIFEKILKTVQEAKNEIVTSGYIAGDEFPDEQKQKEAIGNIVENTAFLGDIVLRSPDIAHKLFARNKEWKLLTLWSLSFTNNTRIYDDTDSKLLHLMAQELNLIPRDANYFNPFSDKAKIKNSEYERKTQKETQNSSKHETKRDKKKKKSKGPRLSHAEL
ncbi:coiled-coil domain-containing protein 134-like [Xenia sp. Carnegie-2017]|uniref:coiled-coil domain-containing protein 134-like n=1 Tax=Xenia sp. Carnegie-2017 TaxID=2897299 RepID=UPI001F04EA1B|nr:coiled-coil domain-containing protein 134-like [Xenia sp. Carnegie-2017]